jgi:hypothetical protein
VTCAKVLTACTLWCENTWNWTPSLVIYLCSPAVVGIKQHSTYRLGFAVVEYRWHPLHGQQVRVVRRTGRAGNEVVHVEVSGELARELPAWMLDPSICCGMRLGSPEVSIKALVELRSVLSASSVVPSSFVNSSKVEDGSNETTTSTVPKTNDTAAGGCANVLTAGGDTRGSSKGPRRPPAGGLRRDVRQPDRGKARRK